MLRYVCELCEHPSATQPGMGKTVKSGCCMRCRTEYKPQRTAALRGLGCAQLEQPARHARVCRLSTTVRLFESCGGGGGKRQPRGYKRRPLREASRRPRPSQCKELGLWRGE